jgi:hypothetical protein
MTQIQPAFVEYPLLLHPKNFERCHGGAVDSKYTLLRVVDDQIFSVEHRVPLVDTSTREHPAYTTLEHQARKRLPPMGPLIHFMEPARAGVLSYSTVWRGGKDGARVQSQGRSAETFLIHCFS